MNFITAALSFLANLVGWGKDVQEERNSPEMQANKEADTRSRDADTINTEIAAANKGDAKAQDALRKDLSED